MAEKSVSTDSLAAQTQQNYTGKKLRMAIIGCGGIAQVHLGALQNFPDVEIVAGVDIDPDRLKVMAEKWNVKDTFSDWKKMLKEVQPDAVNICTPNSLHAAPAIDAANSGCHVLTEKPMAMNPRECQRMIDASKKAGKKLAVGFQYRYHPNTDYLLRAREAGTFGNVMFVKCQALRRRGIPNWGVFGQKELQGGGPMIDIGVHVIEMAHYVMGSPKPVAASGNTWTYLGNKPSNVASMWPNWDYKTYTVEDLAIGQIRFDNGALLHIEASFAAHIEKDVWNFNLIGDKVGANWDPPAIFTDTAGTMVNQTPGWLSPKSDFPTLFQYKLRNFVDACLNGTDLRAPGEAGLAVQKILDGVYRSAKAVKEVKID
jgi:predicted dehydrogenase